VNPRTLTLPAGECPAAALLATSVARPWWESAKPARRTELGEVDPETLARAQVGDRTAQERFVRCYERRVHAFLGRSLLGREPVDDLAQEVFLRVLRALPRFEPGAARVSTWIFAIAVRLLADRSRRGRLSRFWFAPFDEATCPGAGPSPEEGAIDREALTAVEVALSELSPEQRMALALFELHELSHAEVAQAMGTSVATVKTRLFRARRTLRKRLPEARWPGLGGRR
jgi:RNA polymerase sigma-70 factor (ECF subfamily)